MPHEQKQPVARVLTLALGATTAMWIFSYIALLFSGKIGGEILFIEATRMPGRKNLILTGQLGDVMQESARAALSWLRSEAERLKIKLQVFDESDIHLHVPAGATPKEGPSAGIGLATALVSLFTGRQVKAGVAMTGEITLRGRVLPVGGIRDKVLAAQRAGIRIVVLPKRNAADLDDDGDAEINFGERVFDVYTSVWSALDSVLRYARCNRTAPAAGSESADLRNVMQ